MKAPTPLKLKGMMWSPADRLRSLILKSMMPEEEKIPPKMKKKPGREVFAEMFATGKAAAAIVEEKGLTQVSDEGEIAAIVDQIIADNPAQAEQYRAGNVKLIGWFVGQVMRATQGKANPKLVNEILTKKLSG